MTNGNVSIGQWADFSSKVTARLWPALKNGVVSGRLNIARFAEEPDLIQRALVHGFSSVQEEPRLLEFVGTVTIPATTGVFVANDKFAVNTKRNAKVLISAVWGNFTDWFLSGDGKTEDQISEQTLRYYKLRQFSVDGPIITELGDEAKAETTLSEMFSLLEKQGKGEDGVLLNNDYFANIFYVKDRNGVLRTVFAYWSGGGWYVDADLVTDPDEWRAGCRVFSRNVLDLSVS